MEKRICRLLLSVVMLLVLAGCEKIDLNKIDNLNNGKILVIGHGGGGFQSYFNPLPDNSMAAINRAIEGLNADGVELDVQLTKDNQLVLYHDQQLPTLTNCYGCVTEATYAELKDCRYNHNAGTNLASGERLVLLEDVLARYATFARKPLIFLDIKMMNACNPAAEPTPLAFAAALSDLILKYDAQDWVFVESNSLDLLLLLQEEHPEFRLLLYTKEIDKDIEVAARNGFYGITTFNNLISKEQTKRAHQQNLMVNVLGVKSRTGLTEAIKKNPDGIQTDNIQLLAELLRRHGDD
ncbi:glycerophosphodiester phosphodiesterase [Pontibacter ruber]|uniref:Glycerophosphodiester phosphodiesterase n=1 Tax=Pontibacter ruber TaxID=1343895 RepID=A0ABW5CYL9_9BACT|nr:glycerophosphodiester phosphodiesterase family protein [Pontibacter ruber]